MSWQVMLPPALEPGDSRLTHGRFRLVEQFPMRQQGAVLLLNDFPWGSKELCCC